MQVERIWLLIARKMSNEASTEELKELDLLLRKDPDQHFNIEVLERIWEKTEESNTEDVEECYQKHLQRMQNRGIEFPGVSEEMEYAYSEKKSFPIIKWLVAACILSLICLSTWWLFQPSKALMTSQELSMNEITTPLGSKSQLRLPDSTVVWLNAGSKLTYPKEFGQDLREVTLVGEAYFEVKKKGTVPFIIHTHRMDIKVLGTSFNVKSYPGEPTTEASLIKGSIEVSLKNRNSAPITLKPKEKIVVREFTSQQEDTAISTAEVKSNKEEAAVAIKSIAFDQTYNTVLESAWVNNLLVFTEMEFSEVVKLMERWYGMTIQLENKKLANQKLTGSFKNETIYQALEALQFVVDFKYERLNGKQIIIK